MKSKYHFCEEKKIAAKEKKKNAVDYFLGSGAFISTKQSFQPAKCHLYFCIILAAELIKYTR